jgi:hypothetical protein
MARSRPVATTELGAHECEPPLMTLRVILICAAGSLQSINSRFEIFDKCRTPIKIASILADASRYAKHVTPQ